MNNHKLNFFIISCIPIMHGLYCILISKDKVKNQTLKKDKAKKVFFTYGIISISVGFLLFLFFLLIMFSFISY